MFSNFVRTVLISKIFLILSLVQHDQHTIFLIVVYYGLQYLVPRTMSREN